MTGVVFALGVLCLVVLWDAMLLSFLGVLPVSLERDVEMLSMASRLNTSCVGVGQLVVWTVELTAWRTAAETPLQPKSLSRSLLPPMFLVLIMSPMTC